MPLNIQPLTERIQYGFDIARGLRQYPCGLTHPRVVLGYFDGNTHAEAQKILFHSLMKAGFRRTVWQLVFPGQTAGIIHRTQDPDGPNEHHVRFYKDGTIDCELEYDRFHRRHWTDDRVDGNGFLQSFINDDVHKIAVHQREIMLSLLGSKGFTMQCVRKAT